MYSIQVAVAILVFMLATTVFIMVSSWAKYADAAWRATTHGFDYQRWSFLGFSLLGSTLVHAVVRGWDEPMDELRVFMIYTVLGGAFFYVSVFGWNLRRARRLLAVLTFRDQNLPVRFIGANFGNASTAAPYAEFYFLCKNRSGLNVTVGREREGSMIFAPDGRVQDHWQPVLKSLKDRDYTPNQSRCLTISQRLAPDFLATVAAYAQAPDDERFPMVFDFSEMLISYETESVGPYQRTGTLRLPERVSVDVPKRRLTGWGPKGGSLVNPG